MLPLVSHPIYSQVPLPAGHRFPMGKFAALKDLVCKTLPRTSYQLIEPQVADDDVLALAHCPDYLRRFRQGELDRQAIRRQGLPWSEALVQRSIQAVGGTLLTARLALDHGLACHLAGGTHHAHRDFGAGYCVLNDLAVTALWARAAGLAERILILDCDVHQGDGTASILADQPDLFTISLHAAKNFPARKAGSDLDIPLDDGTDDEAYLTILRGVLSHVLDDVCPDLILYDAGVDVHQDDKLGRLMLSDEGLARRDELVFRHAWQRQIPLACVIGGGYADDLQALVARHAILPLGAAKFVQENLNTR